jgi:hypothetical protein
MHTSLSLDLARAIEDEIRRRVDRPQRHRGRRTRPGTGQSGATNRGEIR